MQITESTKNSLTYMLARLSCRERNRYYVCTVKQKKIWPTMTFNVFLSKYWNKKITLNVKKYRWC